MLIDIHTHNLSPTSGALQLINCKLQSTVPAQMIEFCSVGIHPWWLNVQNADKLMLSLTDLAYESNVLAIGESGLDTLRGPDLRLQLNCFEAQVRLADLVKKPMIIHCVKAFDKLLHVHKNISPVSSWIIHGFRGKVALMEQLLARGMYISFGAVILDKPTAQHAFRSVPLDRFFLETDDAALDIAQIYKAAAVIKGLSVDELVDIVDVNFNSVFRNNDRRD